MCWSSGRKACSPARSRERSDKWRALDRIGTLAFLLVAAMAPTLPAWLVSLATVAFANALVVLGLVILWRAGLVSFGQALFYAVGAYTMALMTRYTELRDVFV